MCKLVEKSEIEREKGKEKSLLVSMLLLLCDGWIHSMDLPVYGAVEPGMDLIQLKVGTPTKVPPRWFSLRHC